MSAKHVWICGKCGARVVATVGAIAPAFTAHAGQCPALPRWRPRPAARRHWPPIPPPAASTRQP
jgi:hypothetical protein